MTKAAKKAGAFDSKETIAAAIPVGEMVIDEYQGHVNNSVVDKIAKHWSDSAAGAVILNLREDNTYAVLDGQHRVLAAKRVGVTELNALVFIGKSREEEAKLFVQLNTKHNVSSIDRFRANLVAGSVREKTIRAAIREVGLEINFKGGSRGKGHEDSILCVGALVNIYDNFGLPLLKITLGALTAAFHKYPDRRKAYSQSAVLGTAQFIYRYPHAKVSRLIEKMGSKSPTVLVAMGERKLDAHSDLWTGWGKMLVELYNSGLKPKEAISPEPMAHKLYSPKAKEEKSTSLRESWKRLTPEQQEAKRQNLRKAGEVSARNRKLRAQQKRMAEIKMTMNNVRPLRSSLAEAAKKVKG